ncbi:MAG TPA: LPXTG cell wall anchor domain-containing protein [Acidimicrobiia bacterium]|nr:LPXTG cell wall anchor domain-containing protein [Acidimicrobiia bacterium]
MGKADNKNPHGQMPNGSDHNAGYECDRNHGIGRTNPAHTGCKTASVVIPPNTPPPPPPCVPAPGQNNQCQTPQPPCVPAPGQNVQCQLISVTVPPAQPGVTPVVLGEVLTQPGAPLTAPAVIQPAAPSAQVLGSTIAAAPAAARAGVLPRTGVELSMLLVFAALALGTGALALRYGSRRRPRPLG